MDKSIFSAFPDHFRIAYSDNPIANVLLQSSSTQIDEYVPWSGLMLTAETLIHSTSRLDEDIAGVGWHPARPSVNWKNARTCCLSQPATSGTPAHKVAAVALNPPGAILEIKGENHDLWRTPWIWLEQKLGNWPNCTSGAFHFMPPHAPYVAEKVFYSALLSRQSCHRRSPEHMFTSHLTTLKLDRKRAEYYEFILNVDRDLHAAGGRARGRGGWENTWLVITSDHGKLFERGFKGHGSPLLYQGGIRIPLLIFELVGRPGWIFTSPPAPWILLPTLAHVGGGRAPIGPMASCCRLSPHRQRILERDTLLVVQARGTNHMEAMEQGTISLTRGRHKLIYYVGYPELAGEERMELHDLRVASR